MLHPHCHQCHQALILKDKILNCFFLDDDDYLHLKAHAITHFTEDQTEHITPMHVFHDKGMSFPRILKLHVHNYYRYKSLQEIYENNIFPIIQDQIQYNGKTKPPGVWKKPAGHPKKKRMRKQSKFICPKDSPIICSICRKGGHYKRTCLLECRNDIRKGTREKE